MVQFKKFDIEMANKPLSLLIYGQAGAGKTSLACSAQGAVLFDFDGGVSRINAEFVTDTLQVRTWQEVIDGVAQVKDNPLARVIVFDTLGKMVDFATTHVVGSRTPQIQDWGKINALIHKTLVDLRQTGCDIIFLAQRVVEEQVGKKVNVPDVRATQLREILPDIDAMGFLSMQQQGDAMVRTLTFNPTDSNEGKNSLNYPAVCPLPDIPAGSPYTAMQGILDAGHRVMREREAALRAKGEKIAAAMAEYSTSARASVEEGDTEGLNKLLAEANKMDAYTRQQVVREVHRIATEGGYVYDKATRAYIPSSTTDKK